MIEELMNNAVLVAVVLAPITTGIIEVIKSASNIEERYLPAISLVVGILIALLIAVLFDQEIAQFLLVGIVGGLSASGLYDQAKISK